MKNKDELFSEKMPSHLKNKILEASSEHLNQNKKKHSRSYFLWMFGSLLTAMSASYIYFKLPKNNHIQSLSQEMSENLSVVEDFEHEEDIDLLVEMEILEDFEFIEKLDEET